MPKTSSGYAARGREGLWRKTSNHDAKAMSISQGGFVSSEASIYSQDIRTLSTYCGFFPRGSIDTTISGV